MGACVIPLMSIYSQGHLTHGKLPFDWCLQCQQVYCFKFQRTDTLFQVERYSQCHTQPSNLHLLALTMSGNFALARSPFHSCNSSEGLVTSRLQVRTFQNSVCTGLFPTFMESTTAVLTRPNKW